MSYLLAGGTAELDRLRLQAAVWESAGDALCARLERPDAPRTLDVGCGPHGWLPVLARWVGDDGVVVGTDVDERLLVGARALVRDLRLGRVRLLRDDLFATALAPASFDLVHARFQLSPLGRCEAQLQAYRRLLRPGGWLVLEDPDVGSWHYNPPAPAAERLIALVVDAFARNGGEFDVGRRLPTLVRTTLGVEPSIDARVVALPPRHPYLRLPLHFAAALRPRLLARLPPDVLDALLAEVEDELAAPSRWGTTFTLVQTWTRLA